MSQFSGRAVRLLAVLGVSCVILILVGYHEISSEDPYLLSTFRHVSHKIGSAVGGTSKEPTEPDSSAADAPEANPPPSTQPTNPSSTPFDGDPELLANATKYVHAIMDPDDTTFDRLSCPRLDTKRYDSLKPTSTKPSYFFALNFRQKVDLLPRLMGSILETIRFLGPDKCVLSIVEGHSTDGSFEVLKLLQSEVEHLGAQYHFVRSEIDPSAGDRIGALASLRNLALNPLLISPQSFDPSTTILFLNDVALCPEDILELAHQRQALGADMTCGMDWTYVGRDPTFYDVWVARTIAGDSFFNIPPDGNWNSAWNLFWNAPKDREAFQNHKPFQVFSCWNGVAVFSARPLLEDGIRFRKAREGECFQGEPQLFCKDLWYAGYGKVAVVPSVNLEYDDEHARKIKGLKGFTSQWTERDEGSVVEWVEEPPEKVKCMASYENQEWRPWDEGLPGDG